jgi:hypothetical protein
MRPLSHFGSLVAALAVGLALTVAGGVRYLASAPTIPAKDVIKAPVRAHPTASTLSNPRPLTSSGHPIVIRSTIS